MNTILIKSENPEQKATHKYSAQICNGFVYVCEGHSKEANFNFVIEYDKNVWGTEQERCRFIEENFITPYLLENKIITQDDDGFYWIKGE